MDRANLVKAAHRFDDLDVRLLGTIEALMHRRDHEERSPRGPAERTTGRHDVGSMGRIALLDEAIEHVLEARDALLDLQGPA